jgi:hypothetical protein
LGTYNNGGNVFVSSGYDVDVLSAGWHHLTAVGSGASTVYYIDGVNVGTASFKSTSQISYIGNFQGGGQQFGTIDDVRIYNRALSTSEISTLFNLGHITSGLVGYWPMDTLTTSGGITYDSAGAGLLTRAATVAITAPTPPVISSFTYGSLTATTRVRKSTPTQVSFSWNITNPPATCTISGPAGFTALTITPVNGVTGSQTGTVNISQSSVFTLTCGTVTKKITIGLIPSVNEI